MMGIFIEWINFVRQWRNPCLFRLLTGYYCPGCGGTRSVIALLRGKLLLSFCYHPIVLYGACVAVLFLLSKGLALITGDKKWSLSFHYTYIYVGIGLIVLNFLVKNIVLGVWGLPLLGVLDEKW